MSNLWIQLVMLGLLIFSFEAKSENLCTEINDKKIYISHEKIILLEKGILLLTNKGVKLIDQLNCDENGLYVFSSPD